MAALAKSPQFGDITDLVLDMDLLVHVVKEFWRPTSDPSPGFWRSAVESMRRLLQVEIASPKRKILAS